MKLEPIIQSQVSQKKKKPPIQYINAYIWNLDGEGNGIPLQYSCLENPMDRGAWQDTVREVTKSQSRLSIHTLHHP